MQCLIRPWQCGCLNLSGRTCATYLGALRLNKRKLNVVRQFYATDAQEMAVNTWAAFAGSDDAAVVDGDFAMTDSRCSKPCSMGAST